MLYSSTRFESFWSFMFFGFVFFDKACRVAVKQM